MDRRRLLRGLWPAGFAIAGVIGGHSLTYLAAVPEHIRRWQLLRTTGHAHFGGFVALAVVLGCLSLLVLLARSVKAGLRHAAPPPFAPVWRFVGLQLTLFVALESGERIATGTSLSVMLTDRVFLLGLIVQVIVALAAAIGLRWLARVVSTVARALAERRPATSPIDSAPVSNTVRLRPRLDAGALGVRGPPVAAFF